MDRRDRAFLAFSLTAFLATALLVATAARLLWSQSIGAEERKVAALAESIGQRTEELVIEARDTLDRLNGLPVEPCSPAHREAMGRAAFAAPHILQIGYWEAAERQCGAGFTEAIELKPPKADKIYDSGVIAWWPGPDTAVDGTELFLMRLGHHDMALDPRALLQATPTRDRQIGLWVEGLRMAAVPWDADLPAPQSLADGLSIDRASDRLVARFSLDTVVPIDVVVTEPVASVWKRYWPMASMTAVAVLLLVTAWLYAVLLYRRRQLSAAGQLREALSAGVIDAEFQPIVELDSGRCIGAEALVRWTDPDGESIPPEEFMPVAEHAGIAPRITLTVLDATLERLGGLLARHPELRIHLNLAAEDLQSNAFADALAERLQSAAVPASAIKLEITERSLVDSDQARGVIDRLRAQGHEIAIDDFGTGYSSLSYLEKFHVDTLKIDKTFVNAIDTEAVTSHVIHHIIAIAHDLRLNMVAEGVEMDAQAQWLQEHGVRLGQGFLFSRPLSAERFEAFVHDGAL